METANPRIRVELMKNLFREQLSNWKDKCGKESVQYNDPLASYRHYETNAWTGDDTVSYCKLFPVIRKRRKSATLHTHLSKVDKEQDYANDRDEVEGDSGYKQT